MSAPTNVSPFPPPRVAPNLTHALGGIWHLTYRRFLTPAALLQTAGTCALLGVLAWEMVGQGDARGFSQWMSSLYCSSVLPILAFLFGAGAIRDEMKPSAVDYTLTRPVPRPAFVTFKFLSHLACLQVIYLGALAVLLGVGAVQQIPGLADAWPRLWLAQTLTITAFLSFGYLCGALTSRYIVIGLIWGGVIEVGLGRIPLQVGRLSMTHQVRALLEPVLRDVRGDELAGQSALGVTAGLLCASLVMLGLAVTLFSRRELTGERDA